MVMNSQLICIEEEAVLDNYCKRVHVQVIIKHDTAETLLDCNNENFMRNTCTTEWENFLIHILAHYSLLVQIRKNWWL